MIGNKTTRYNNIVNNPYITKTIQKTEEKMKIKRTREIETEKDGFEQGDILPIKLANGEKHEAIAIKDKAGGMLFIMQDMFDDYYCMNSEVILETEEQGILSHLNTGEISNPNCWEESELRQIANNKLLDMFPQEIREMMIPFSNGDYLQPPAMKYVVGNDVLPFFMSDDNRISYRKGSPCSYWLKDTIMGTCYTYMKTDATIEYELALSKYIGFRPMFILKNEIKSREPEKIRYESKPMAPSVLKQEVPKTTKHVIPPLPAKTETYNRQILPEKKEAKKIPPIMPQHKPAGDLILPERII